MKVNYSDVAAVVKPNYSAMATQLINQFLQTSEAVMNLTCTNLEEAKAYANPISKICRHEYPGKLECTRSKNIVSVSKMYTNPSDRPNGIDDDKVYDEMLPTRLKTVSQLCDEYGINRKGFPKLERGFEYGMLQYLGRPATIISRWKDSCIIVEDNGKYAWNISNFEEV